MGLDAMILVFWMLSFKTTFSTLFFHFHQKAFIGEDINLNTVIEKKSYTNIWNKGMTKQQLSYINMKWNV